MSNIVSFHPRQSSLKLFYEVVEEDGQTRWGGASAFDAVTWFKLAPAGSRMLISGWESDDVDAMPVGQPLDVTDLIAAIRSEL